MRIGFIGAKAVAQTIAKHVLPAGHEVVLSNSRGPDTLTEIVEGLGKGVRAGSARAAAEQDIVVLAVDWRNVQAALFSVGDWKGKILVDATNRMISLDPPSLGDLTGRTSSEIVADLAQGARVVKAFNSVPMAWISDFTASKPKTALFVSGDDPAAKRPVADLIDEVGFQAIDLGPLAIGGRIQQLGGPLAGIRLEFRERFSL